MTAKEYGALTRTGYLDGWRGVSIACVLQGHFVHLPIDFGSFGVSMFFCLSGMLVSNILFIQRQSLPRFYKRRISRIVPTFIVFVVVMFMLCDFWGRPFSWIEFWSTLLFSRTYFPSPGIWQTGMPIGHIWSLNVEEHSYVFMSLITLAAFMRRREWLLLMLCGVACIITGFIYARLGRAAPFWGTIGTEVAASFVLVSAGYHVVCDQVRKWIPPWLPIVTLIMAVAISQYAPWWVEPLVSPFLLAFTVNHLSEAFEWFRTLLSNMVLRQIGLWSFSIYLWQQPFYSLQSSFPGGSLTALACAMGAALLSFYLIENPCRTWLNQNWNSRNPLKPENKG